MTIIGYIVQARPCADERPPVYLVWEVWSPRKFSHVLMATRDGERAEFVKECFEARRARLALRASTSSAGSGFVGQGSRT